MKARSLKSLLSKKDRVGVSNITGREASKVSVASQRFFPNIVAGWALGKSGQNIEGIPVYGTFLEMSESLPEEQLPNKIIVYSPPAAVYGEIKEIVDHGSSFVDTIFTITENVSIEVTAKIHKLCSEAGVDVIGCNTLGMINVYDHVRVGAVGGNNPDDSFKPGSTTIISNSGNMTNTMASYLTSAGIGTAFGISTGKDVLILTPLKELLPLGEKDRKTKLVVLYVEPGGVYEQEVVEAIREKGFSKPIIVYITGKVMEKAGPNLSLGHAGAVVENSASSASSKMGLFDDYFGCDPFDPDNPSLPAKEDLCGVRITSLHHLPLAAAEIYDTMEWERDFEPSETLRLNPWFGNFQSFPDMIAKKFIPKKATIPEPYASQFKEFEESHLGAILTRRNMRNGSYASSNEGDIPRIFGYPLTETMYRYSFAGNLILYWTGNLPAHAFEERLVEMCLSASLTNGPGTISAQGSKLSTSAGNRPHNAMIATLACIGDVHGGNGGKATRFLLNIFKELDLVDPYDAKSGINLDKLAKNTVKKFLKVKKSAKEAGTDYERIPCLGHPVFRTEEVNYDPRERVIYAYLEKKGIYSIFLEFYHKIAREMYEQGATRRVLAVNVDAAVATIWLGITWPLLRQKKITEQRAADIPFLAFALGRSAGGGAEYLDHQDHGESMDMRIPVMECRSFTRNRELDQ